MNEWGLLTFVALLAILDKTEFIETEEQARQRRKREAESATPMPEESSESSSPVIGQFVGVAICSRTVKLLFGYFG